MSITLLGSVQRVCSAAEEAAWLQGGSLQAGGETVARGDGQDEGVLGRNSQCKSRKVEEFINHFSTFPTVQSLANSNRNLLLENKGLYQQLKDGVENMKQEKVIPFCFVNSLIF